MTSPARRRTADTRRSILVGTDFSSASADALARAADIARETDATLHVVHASRRLPAALARSLGIRDERFVSRALGDVAKQISAERTRVRTHQVHGAAANALRDKCREVEAALVVVGTRGRTVPDATIGSTAERIAATERAPVLLVRRKGSVPYDEVVIAADIDTDVGAAVAAARLVAPDARLSILHAYATPFEPTLRLQGASMADIMSYRRQARRSAQAEMAKRLASAGMADVPLSLRHGDPRRVLAGASRKTLVVIERSRSLLRHALLGSVSRWVIVYGVSDVLLV